MFFYLSNDNSLLSESFTQVYIKYWLCLLFCHTSMSREEILVVAILHEKVLSLFEIHRKDFSVWSRKFVCQISVYSGNVCKCMTGVGKIERIKLPDSTWWKVLRTFVLVLLSLILYWLSTWSRSLQLPLLDVFLSTMKAMLKSIITISAFSWILLPVLWWSQYLRKKPFFCANILW